MSANPPGALTQAAMRLASTRLGGWFFTTVTPGLDRWLLRRTVGRYSLAGLGVPTLLLTTIGRKSGQPRSTPLLYLADGEHLIIIASRGGRRAPPAWLLNLQHTPEAKVLVAGKTQHCSARVCSGAERARYWDMLLTMNPYFALYQARLERTIAVIKLTPSVLSC